MEVSYRKMTVNIPTNALSQEVQMVLARLTRLAGGATVHTADGYWYNPDGGVWASRMESDVVRVYSWTLATDLDLATWCSEIRNLYSRMFDTGEDAVYFEQHNEGNFMAGIVYPSDVEQDSEH